MVASEGSFGNAGSVSESSIGTSSNVPSGKSSCGQLGGFLNRSPQC